MMAILETMIGIIFVFTLVSLVSSVVVEWISGIFAVRGKNLKRGMESMLGNDVAKEVREHPLIKALKRESWVDVFPWMKSIRHKPSYVPAETFTQTLLAKIQGSGSPASDLAGLKALVKNWAGGGKAREAVQALVDEATTLEQAKKNLREWYDSTMDRATGWYKRWTQLTLFLVGFAIAFWMGIDSLAITKALWTNPDLRVAVADAAADYVEQNASEFSTASGEDGGNASGREGTVEAERVVAGLRQLTVDLQEQRLPLFPWGGSVPLDHLLGFLLTAVAVSLGAQFWFDLLAKLVKLRAAGPSPDEKKKSES